MQMGTASVFLYATTDGSSTTLTGTINGEIAENDILTLEFLSEYYDQQEGTLEFIATHSDYAKAEVRITSISGGSVKTTDAVFENQQAIVKFTLQDMSQNNLNATLLEVTVDGTTYTVDPANDATTNVFYVAIPGFSNKAITLTATVGDDTYTKTFSDKTFNNGQYYTITVGLEQEPQEPTNYTTLQNGYIIKVGDTFTPTGKGWWANNHYEFQASVTYTLIRANLTQVDNGHDIDIIIAEAADGDYYVFKGIEYGEMFGEPTINYQFADPIYGSTLPVTGTSDGILVSNVSEGETWNRCTMSVHEPSK